MNRIAYLIKLADDLDAKGDSVAADAIDANVTTAPQYRRWRDMTPEQRDKAWQLFEKSYTKAYETEVAKAAKEGREPNVVKPWDRGHFESRARSWSFYGDDNGYVTARFQQNKENPDDSMFKLVGTAGSPKSQLKGFIELQKSGKAIWGVVTENIKDMAVRFGFITPSAESMKILRDFIPEGAKASEMISGINDDGSIQVNMPNSDQVITKFYIANDLYYKALAKSNLSKFDIEYTERVGDLFLEFVKTGSDDALLDIFVESATPKFKVYLESKGINLDDEDLEFLQGKAKQGLETIRKEDKYAPIKETVTDIFKERFKPDLFKAKETKEEDTNS